MTQAVLYRMFADDDALLYTGITKNPTMRFMQHAADKDWWPQVRKITLEYHESMTAAQEAERMAIKDERPVMNIRHSPGQTGETPIRHVRVSDDLWNDVIAESEASGDSRTAIVVAGIKRELAHRSAAAKRSR